MIPNQNCPRCGRSMQVSEVANDATQRCTFCATGITDDFLDPAGNSGMDSSIDSNPYASPQGIEVEKAAADLSPPPIEFVRVLMSTWNVFRQNIGIAVLFGAFQLLIQGLLYWFHELFDSNLKGYLTSIAVIVLADFYLLLGGIAVTTHLVRTGAWRWWKMFPSLSLYWSWLGVVVVHGGIAAVSLITVTVGTALISITGIHLPKGELWSELRHALALGLLFAVAGYIVFKKFLNWLLCPSLISDLHCFAWTAVVESENRMRKNDFATFLLLVFVGLGGLLLSAVTFGLGLILVIPFWFILWSTIYVQASGIRFASDDNP